MNEISQIIKAPIRLPTVAFELAMQVPMTAAALVLGAAIPGVITRRNDEIERQSIEQRQRAAYQGIASESMGQEVQTKVMPFPPQAERVRVFADDRKRPLDTHGQLISRVMKGVHQRA